MPALIALVGGDHALRSSRPAAIADICVLHDRNPLFVTLRDGSIRNAYTVRLLNKRAGRPPLRAHGRRSARHPASRSSARRGDRRRPYHHGRPRSAREVRVLVTVPAGARSRNRPAITFRASRPVAASGDRARSFHRSVRRADCSDHHAIDCGPSRATAREPDLTGRTVLICMLGFFGVVVGRQRRDDDARDRHAAGHRGRQRLRGQPALQRRDRARARAQDARGWQVVGACRARRATARPRPGRGARRRRCAADRRSSLPPALARPTDKRARPRRRRSSEQRDRPLPRPAADVAPGQWDLVLEARTRRRARCSCSRNRRRRCGEGTMADDRDISPFRRASRRRASPRMELAVDGISCAGCMAKIEGGLARRAQRHARARQPHRTAASPSNGRKARSIRRA